MKEELEEGHFDTEGNYHWKKEEKIKDNWLENIDWVKVLRILCNIFISVMMTIPFFSSPCHPG
jgi:hypothetical protein